MSLTFYYRCRSDPDHIFQTTERCIMRVCSVCNGRVRLYGLKDSDELAEEPEEEAS